jgi:aspartate-semialdehyde dehydrogenase
LASAKPGVRLAIVGGETLLGRELRDLISDHRLASKLDLIAGDETPAPKDPEDDDDAPVEIPLTAESVRASKVIFLAGSPESSRRVAEFAPNAFLIDLTGTLPGALRAPSAEPERYLAPEAKHVTIAHPASILLASLLRKLMAIAPVEKVVATLFEPASQRGRLAVDELQKQAVGLLSFRDVPQEVFGAQLAFNLLPRFGTEVEPPLADTDRLILAELAVLAVLPPPFPIPSVRVLQAPVFHGYAASAWVKFAAPPSLEAVASALKPQSDFRDEDVEPPTNVSVAGQSGLAIDTLRADPADPSAIWIWAAADNLRLIADNALLTAAAILEQAARPVQ